MYIVEVRVEREGVSVGEQGGIGEVGLERGGGSIGEHDDSITNDKRGRKRVRNEKEWARNITKRRKNHGKDFINHLDKTRQARKMKIGCGMNCRYKCHANISQDERGSMFNSFWSLGDVTRQRQFLLKYAGPKPKASIRVMGSFKKAISFQWSLPCNGIVRVCKTFILHTVSISDQMVHTALLKSSDIPGVCDPEKQGKHKARPNKTPTHQVNFVKTHIESFPKIESYCCRKDSKYCICPQNSV